MNTDVLASDCQWLDHDNLDDRKEVCYLLSRLPPKKRLAFVRWCCRRSIHKHGYSPTHPDVLQKTMELAEQARWDSSADERLTLDLFFDTWQLNRCWHLDLDVALNKLVELVKKQT